MVVKTTTKEKMVNTKKASEKIQAGVKEILSKGAKAFENSEILVSNQVGRGWDFPISYEVHNGVATCNIIAAVEPMDDDLVNNSTYNNLDDKYFNAVGEDIAILIKDIFNKDVKVEKLSQDRGVAKVYSFSLDN